MRTLTGSARVEQLVIVAGLLGVAGLGWLYTLRLAAGMAMPGMTMDGHGMDMVMPQLQPWQPADVLLTFLMWSVMMVAMMTPSAAPMIVTFAALIRRRASLHGVGARTSAFLLGYLLVWTGFSAGATLLQWGLDAAGSLSAAAVRATPAVGGSLLVLAGAWQLTPLRDACLASCQAPVSFLVAAWRDGARGALHMGARHGAYCLGCCWALMLVLFAVGVMNLLWVAAIAGYVLAEKLLPSGRWLGRAAGVLLIAAGAWLLLAGSAAGLAGLPIGR